MNVTKEKLKKELADWVTELGGSSYENIWAYMKRVFDIRDNNDSQALIDKSYALERQIVENHFRVPDLCPTTLSEEEKFDYIRLMAVLTNAAIR